VPTVTSQSSQPAAHGPEEGVGPVGRAPPRGTAKGGISVARQIHAYVATTQRSLSLRVVGRLAGSRSSRRHCDTSARTRTAQKSSTPVPVAVRSSAPATRPAPAAASRRRPTTTAIGSTRCTSTWPDRPVRAIPSAWPSSSSCSTTAPASAPGWTETRVRRKPHERSPLSSSTPPSLRRTMQASSQVQARC
jgi:hypothetical protein